MVLCGFSFITVLFFTTGVGAIIDSSNLLLLREPEAPRAIGGFLFGEAFRLPGGAGDGSFFWGVPETDPLVGGFLFSRESGPAFALAGDSRFAGEGAMTGAAGGCSFGSMTSTSSSVFGKESSISASSAFAASIIFLVRSSALALATSSGSVPNEAAGFKATRTSSSSS